MVSDNKKHMIDKSEQPTHPHPRPLYIIALTFHIPSGPPDQYLALTLRHLGFDKFNTNLLSIPPAVFLIINVSRKQPQPTTHLITLRKNKI